MTRRRQDSPFRNTIVIGAVTVLVTIIAVYLAYNANGGLPFVPTYNIDVVVPDAAGLVATDSVLIGGNRVGYVATITGTKLPNGRYAAVLHLKLDKSVQPLPSDSTDLVRPVSPLGLKYLEIERGHSSQGLPPNATIPISQTSLPVEIDDVFNMFNPPTRVASKSNFDVFGDALAGRGADLNQALSQLQPLVYNLLPVTTNLSDPQTHLAALFPSLEQAAHEVVGVAHQDADLFVQLDQTFTPLAQTTPALQAAISGGPAALSAGARELPAQAQFIRDTTELFHRFRPAFVNLSNASVQLAPAISAGIPALRTAPALTDRLSTTLSAIQGFAQDPRTPQGLTLLINTANLLLPTIAFATPTQTTCNYLALFFRNLENAISTSDDVGSFLRVVALPLPQLPNSEAGPASAPANGPPASKIPGLTPATATLVDDSFLHSNPYPNTAAPGQPLQCAAGNEQYVAGRKVIGAPPSVQRLTPPTEATKRVLP